MADRHHGGDIYQREIAWDFSVNVNPMGPPVRVQQAIRESADHVDCYPDPQCRGLVQALAEYHKTEKERIVCGNGAADLIYRLAYLLKPGRALLLAPTFSEYEQALTSVGCQVRHCRLKEENGFQADMRELADRTEEGELIFLCNPNNPTGLAADIDQVERLARTCRKKKGFLILDECFCEFLEKPSEYSFMERIQDYPEAVILRAFTKSYAMAGLRLGYGVCGDRDVAERLRLTGQPWSVSIPAQEAGRAALLETEYLEQSRSLIAGERRRVSRRLADMGFLVFPSQVNYVLFKDVEECKHGNIGKRLQERGFLIRDCSSFKGLEAGKEDPVFCFYRIAIRRQEENNRLLDAIQGIVLS